MNYALSKSYSKMSILGYKFHRENGIRKIMVLCDFCALDTIENYHNFGLAEKIDWTLIQGCPKL